MTNEEIRLVVHALVHDGKVGVKKRGLWYCPNDQGYTADHTKAGRYTMEEAKEREYPHGEPVTIHQFPPLPYDTDLNACHEMEKALSEGQREDYYACLLDVLPHDENHGPAFEDGEDIMTPSQFTFIHATAIHRCTAFLKVKGKWKE